MPEVEPVVEPVVVPVEEPAKELAPVEIKTEEDIKEHVKEQISVEEANAAITDEVAESILNSHIEEVENCEGKKDIINLDTIAANFNAGDTVTLEELKKKKLINSKIGRVKVLARGNLDKPLTIKAAEFSTEAVKMILLVGGSVVKLKKKQ